MQQKGTCQKFKIQRSKQDLKWIQRKLRQECTIFSIIPRLQFIQTWNSSLPDFMRSQKYNSYEWYQQQMLRRFLAILSQITIKSIYSKPVDKKSSLFIFVQSQKYSYYRDIEQTKKSIKKQIQNTSNKMIQKGFNYFKKLIPMFQKQQINTNYDQRQINKIRKQFQILNQKAKQLQKNYFVQRLIEQTFE